MEEKPSAFRRSPKKKIFEPVNLEEPEHVVCDGDDSLDGDMRIMYGCAIALWIAIILIARLFPCCYITGFLLLIPIVSFAANLIWPPTRNSVSDQFLAETGIISIFFVVNGIFMVMGPRAQPGKKGYPQGSPERTFIISVVLGIVLVILSASDFWFIIGDRDIEIHATRATITMALTLLGFAVAELYLTRFSPSAMNNR